MSVMAWLFGLGAAAVVFPFLFHLIRRTPRGQTDFSSLMFLRASPPRLTRRSRLDNWLLLLLRALAICLLAVAFMRPFFRGNSGLAQFDVDHRRVAILLDVSASMRRGQIWEQATQQVLETLDGLDAADQVALYTFDQKVRAIVDFPDQPSIASGTSQESIRQELADIQPGWSSSNLGTAMVSIADELDNWHDATRSDKRGRRPKLQMVVISDLQATSETGALQAYQWPQLVKVDFRPIDASKTDNATVSLIPPSKEEVPPQVRVRVTNGEDSVTEVFTVKWNRTTETEGDAVPAVNSDREDLSFLVPPGTSRALKVPLESTLGAESFELAGDAESYDNQYYLTSPKQQSLRLLFVGEDQEDNPEQLLFYVQRAFTDTPTRTVEVQQIAPARLTQENWIWTLNADDGERPQSERPADLVVIASALNQQQVEAVHDFAKSGGLVFSVLRDETMAMSLAPLTGATPNPSPESGEYRILGSIDYGDSVFQPFAESSFSDFTAIRFWKYLPVELETDIEVLARFDNRDPALWARSYASGGRSIAVSSGWNPSQSQFALSPKFVVMLANLLELGADLPALDTSLRVGDWIQFPSSDQVRTMIKPNGAQETVEAGQSRYRRTTVPGIYRLQTGNSSEPKINSPETTSFAVNVDRRESDSRVLAIEQLERLGVQSGKHTTATAELAQLRELRDREIEQKQKIWKWLIVAAIGILIVETLIAGRKSSVIAAGMAS